MSVGVAQITRRRRRQGGIVSYLLSALPASIVASPGAYPVQLQVLENGVDKTSDPLTSYASGNIAYVTVDAPTLTGAPSPASITQGTGPITFTFPATNPNAIQTLGGLTSGLSAGSATVVDPTHISFPLTATGGATPGTANVFLHDTSHGDSNTEPLTVSSSAVNPPLTGAVRRYIATTGTNTTTNGANVTTWTDTINGKVLTTDASAVSVTYVSSSINGKPAIRAGTQSANNRMYEAAYDAAINGTAFSAVIIGKANTTTLSGGGVGLYNGTSAGWQLGQQNSTNMAVSMGPSAFYTYAAGQTAHTFLLTGGASETTFYVDNVSRGSGVSAYAKQTANPLYVFGDAGFNVAWQADICEIIIYDHELSGTERTNLASYVSTVYGL